jgi:hypothetical protein
MRQERPSERRRRQQPRWKLLRIATCDRRLSRADLATLGAVLDRLNSDGVAWPSLARIAEDAAADRRTAARSIARLVEHGFLTRQSGDRTASNRYSMGSGEVYGNSHTPLDCSAGSDEAAPTCSGESVPTPSGESVTTGSDEAATRVVASSPLGVVASSPPELASLNLPSEPAQLNLPNAGAGGDRFKEFKSLYPRKEAWPAAERAWRRQSCAAAAEKILADVKARIADPGQWRERQYTPLPATYLNGRRWEDDWASSADASPAIPVGLGLADRALHRLRGIVARSPEKFQLPRDSRSQEDIDAANEAAVQRIGGGHGS